MTVRLRPEQPADEAAVQALIAAAFAPADHHGGPVIEEVLNDALRSDPNRIGALSLVAVLDDHIVGQVTASYGSLEHPDPAVRERRVLAIGPVAVLPARQRQGIGSALVRAVLAAAETAGEPVVLLLGSPDYYGRFGFVAASELRIEAPEPAWGAYFQARTLAGYDGKLVGRFRYAAPFDDL